jgi:hypothetical protein
MRLSKVLPLVENLKLVSIFPALFCSYHPSLLGFPQKNSSFATTLNITVYRIIVSFPTALTTHQHKNIKRWIFLLPHRVLLECQWQALMRRNLAMVVAMVVQFLLLGEGTHIGKSRIHVWIGPIHIRSHVHVWGYSYTYMEQGPFFLVQRSIQSRANLEYVETMSLLSHSGQKFVWSLEKKNRHVRTHLRRVTIICNRSVERDVQTQTNASA